MQASLTREVAVTHPLPHFGLAAALEESHCFAYSPHPTSTLPASRPSFSPAFRL